MIWKKIPNYSKYEASNCGLIKTFNWKNTGKTAIMKPASDACGYLRTMLINDFGKTETIKVHRIIAQTFLLNEFNKSDVNHINGIKTDNSVINLEWNTRKENVQHAHKNLTWNKAKGSTIAQSKLTEKKVLEIRLKFKPRVYTRIKLAKEYNVSEACIKDILYKRTWNHL